MLTGEVLGVQRPVTLPTSATVRDAAAAMRDHDIGDVLIVDDSGALTGILTDRDLVVRVVAVGRDPGEATVAEACSRELVTVDATQSVEDAVEIMREHALRRLPVVTADRKKIHGVISLGDLAVQTKPEEKGAALADISRAPANN